VLTNLLFPHRRHRVPTALHLGSPLAGLPGVSIFCSFAVLRHLCQPAEHDLALPHDFAYPQAGHIWLATDVVSSLLFSGLPMAISTGSIPGIHSSGRR
jgi:hypothetical protein